MVRMRRLYAGASILTRASVAACSLTGARPKRRTLQTYRGTVWLSWSFQAEPGPQAYGSAEAPKHLWASP